MQSAESTEWRERGPLRFDAGSHIYKYRLLLCMLGEDLGTRVALRKRCQATVDGLIAYT